MEGERDEKDKRRIYGEKREGKGREMKRKEGRGGKYLKGKEGRGSKEKRDGK